MLSGERVRYRVGVCGVGRLRGLEVLREFKVGFEGGFMVEGWSVRDVLK